MTTRVLINERDSSTTPIDLRVVLYEPRHTEDDVIAAQRRGSEIEFILVVAEANGDGRQDTCSWLRATISECYGVGRATCDEGQRVFGDERRRDEVAVGAAVDESDRGYACNESSQTKEATARLRELIDLARHRLGL